MKSLRQVWDGACRVLWAKKAGGASGTERSACATIPFPGSPAQRIPNSLQLCNRGLLRVQAGDEPLGVRLKARRVRRIRSDGHALGASENLII